MAASITELRIENPQDLAAQIYPGWVYRGQQSSIWSLQTSLERCFERHSITKSKHKRDVEIDLIREFRRAYHQHSYHIPSPDNTIEWLSLMQHHGAPTRLLDFTYSIYVATYFAVECATKGKDPVVWALNPDWAQRESIKILVYSCEVTVEQARVMSGRITEASDPVFSKVIFDSNMHFVYPVNAFRLNERLRIQKGLFFAPGCITESFRDNLMQLKGCDSKENALKLIIPEQDARLHLQQLFQMNITRATLFPGLDGYAQSLGTFHPSFAPDDFNFRPDKSDEWTRSHSSHGTTEVASPKRKGRKK